MMLALDIGASNIRIAYVNGTNITQKQTVKTPKRKKAILKVIQKLIESYDHVFSILVATAGVELNGKIQHALNIDLNNVPLRKFLHTQFKVPVYVDNDANCAGLAELRYGAGKNKKNFILLTLGTGIGGAIIVNRKLYRGNGAGGEIGSMILDRGYIFEHLASGTASVSIAHQLGLKRISSFGLEELAKKRDRKARYTYDIVGRYLGLGISNLIRIFDPDAIILGGGFARVKFIWPELRKTVRRMDDLKRNVPILKAKFGDDAGLIGAVLLAKEK